MNRREFLRSTSFASVALLARPSSSQVATSADAEVEITPQPDGPQISPHLYGQFVEHLGGVIYDGIWVGPNSKIPNLGGIRKQFVDDLKSINVPNFRWPGGCFADGYHWRDGLSTPAKRPRTYNYWQATSPAGVDATESNQFGIHEFMHLCRLTGADPYLAANMNSGSPQEFHDWVSYCNAPLGTLSLAAERAANGDPAPFAVRWWGVGNESWGCGGDMSPADYATYRRFVTQFPAYAPKPFLVAVGPRGHSKDLDVGWTEAFLAAMQGHKSPVDGLSTHFYTDFRNRPERVATFTERGWYDVLREGLRTQQVIDTHWQILGNYDPQHHTKLVIDEWGVWYRPGEEIAPAYLLSQPLTLRDALHTALTLDIFNRNAGKIAMANVAQTINCLHSLFLAQGDRFARTPVFYVFALYRAHMGAQLAATRIRCDALTVPSDLTAAGPASMPGLSVSASTKEKILTVTLTNPSLSLTLRTRLRISSGTILEARASVLTHPDMAAANTLTDPNHIQLAPLPVSLRDSAAELLLSPKSVTAVELRLA